MKTTLTTGEVIDIDVAEAVCRCGERAVRIGGQWGHGDELVGRARRHWMGGRFNHDASPDWTKPHTSESHALPTCSNCRFADDLA